MKPKAIGLTLVGGAVAALLAACGGGSGDAGSAATPSSVQLTGVAATGLALANSTVAVKCASGTGSATTNDSGSYTVTVVDGAMPCLIKVTGTADGVEVTLHSVAEAGTTSGSTTSATANVTPLTEMILARAAGTVPAALFENFNSTAAAAITSTTLNQATTDVLTTLRDVLGVDSGPIADPFKASLVADTASNSTAGNAYDNLLEALKTQVSIEELPHVVNQIASTGGGSAPFSLNEVMGNVKAGSLAGCAPALSGKYRVIEYTGAVVEVDINFSTLKLNSPDGEATIVPSTTQACQFTVDTTTVVIGPSGAGAIVDGVRTGYIFPVQAHSFASVQGKWEFMESGIEEGNLGVHFVGEVDVAADGKVALCEYKVMENDFTTCAPETDEAISLQEQTGGHFVLNYGADASPAYGFRAPNGSLTLFGSNNPSGVETAGSLRTHFVLTRPQSAILPAVGDVFKLVDVGQSYAASPNPSTTNGTLSSVIFADTLTVTAVDASAGTVTRTRTRDCRVDTFQYNKPIDGLRYRAASTSPNCDGSKVINIPTYYVRNLPGLGITVGIDAALDSHAYAISVRQP